LLPGADYVLLPAGSADPDSFYSEPSVFGKKYFPFFRKLLMAPDTSAIVFHCSTGVERTGLATGLFLYALDVPLETILHDYLHNAFATGVEKVFNTIRRRYGSIEWFMYKELGVDETVRLKLREKFLQ
jgi:protein-tyrosine phosphatase